MKKKLWLLIIALLILSCDSATTGKHGTSHRLERVSRQLANAEAAQDRSPEGKYYIVAYDHYFCVYLVKDSSLHMEFKLFDGTIENIMSAEDDVELGEIKEIIRDQDDEKREEKARMQSIQGAASGTHRIDRQEGKRRAIRHPTYRLSFSTAREAYENLKTRRANAKSDENDVTDSFGRLRSLKVPHEIVGTGFSPDFKTLFVGLDNGKVLMIDLNSGKKTTLDFGKIVTKPDHFEISKSGKIVLLGDRYMDISKEKMTARDYEVGFDNVRVIFANGEKYIITDSTTGPYSRLGITETSNGKIRRVYPKFSLYSYYRYISAPLHYSLVGILSDNDTIIIDIHKGNSRMYSISLEKEIGAFYGDSKGFSPDNKMLLTSSGNRFVYLWDIASRKRKNTLKIERYLGWLRGTNWVTGIISKNELVILSVESGETVCKVKIEPPDSIKPEDYIESYGYFDYRPSERLLLLKDYRKGYIDAYKIN